MIKDILVHVDGGARDPQVVGAALAVAGRFGARLTGLFARLESQTAATVAQRASDAFILAEQVCRQSFAERTAAAGISTRWWSLAHGESGHVLRETAACARFHDLTVLGQHHQGKPAPDTLAAHVVRQAGRPVLVLPSAGDYPTIGTNVLVAWNAGREAARALHDAIPLLERAEHVEMVTVRGPHPASMPEIPLPPLSVADHLAVHGVSLARDVLAGEGIGVMDLVLSRAFDQGADLLVMGAHGGAGLPFLKGSGTRHILRHMTVPVLMSQ